jgi:TetR/AcrR family transcriptional repressor of nem operon
MMRVTKEQAQATRRRIVETAAEQFRDRGFDGIGVADLMKASGLTHGGFYRHFSSKDDLMAEATALAYEQLERDTSNKPIEDLLGRYISDSHRDEISAGCPTSALGGGAMRQMEPVRSVFAQGVETWIEMIEKSLDDGNAAIDGDRRAQAIELATRAVGAIVLARAAAANGRLSDEILATSLSRALEDVARID